MPRSKVTLSRPSDRQTVPTILFFPSSGHLSSRLFSSRTHPPVQSVNELYVLVSLLTYHGICHMMGPSTAVGVITQNEKRKEDALRFAYCDAHCCRDPCLPNTVSATSHGAD